MPISVRYILSLLFISLPHHIGYTEDIKKPDDPNARYVIAVPEGGLPDVLARKPFPTPFVSAHRGGPQPGYPENALETFDLTTAYGPALIELDIRKSKDGVLHLMHDRTLDRTTTGQGPVADTEWSDIQALYLRDNAGNVTAFRVPSFAAALDWARGRAILMLDMKRGVTGAEVLSAVQAHSAQDYVIFITRSLDEAKALYAADPRIMVNSRARNMDELAELMAAPIPAKHMVVWTGLQMRPPAFYNAIHAAGMVAAMGTLGFDDRAIDRQILAAGDDRRYLEIYQSGVDIISSDRHWAVHQQLRNPALIAITRRAVAR